MTEEIALEIVNALRSIYGMLFWINIALWLMLLLKKMG